MQLSSLTEHFEALLFQPGLTNAFRMGPYKNALCEFSPVNPPRVKLLLDDLVVGKAPGPDGISPRELKFASGDICNSLSVLFNESLASAEMSDDFKHGLLRPTFKPDKTDSQHAANYRGITLNGILSKVLERIVHSQLCDHLKLTKSISRGFSVWFPH